MCKDYLFAGLRVVCALILLVPDARAQVSEFENMRIVDIRVSPQSLDPNDLANALTLKKGDSFHAQDAADTIDRLFATGRFTDVIVEGERSGGGVIVQIVTRPAWFLGGISVEGKIAGPPNRAQIAATPELTLGAPVRDGDVADAVRVIKDLLASNGLYDATVTPEVARDPAVQQVFVTFRIQQHRRAKYEMPVIKFSAGMPPGAPDQRSADRVIPANTPGALAIQNIANPPDNTIIHATGWRIPIIHWWRQVTDARTRQGIQGIRAQYQNKGRLTARVDLEKLDYDASRRRVRPNLTITPGPRVDVKAVEAKVSRGVLKKYVPVFQERAVNNDLLAEGKRNLQNYFQSQGYYRANVDVRSLTPSSDLETFEYVISKGPRYKLVRLSFSGNRYFEDDILRERMFIQTASFSMRHGRYSEAFRRKDEESIANLYRSNGFRDVKVTSDLSLDYQGKPEQVAVTVRIDEGPQWFVDHVAVKGAAQLESKDLIPRLASMPGSRSRR